MAFKTFFQGEGSDDWGGPFRETMATIQCEIESEALPLFVKTANNRNEHGTYRECFIPNPSATSPACESMFKLLGNILGFNIRAKAAIDWHFPPLFWKQVLGNQLSLADLEGSDAYSYQVLVDLSSHGEILDAETFEMSVFEKFTTVLSNGETIELMPGGGEIDVTLANHKKFIELVAKARLDENKKQMNWIKEGIDHVIDLSILQLLDWNAVEIRACGKKEILTSALKAITRYDQSEDHVMCKMFWEMFD
jgi:hypothetical protein